MNEIPHNKSFLLPANFLSYLPVLNETEIRIYLFLLSQSESETECRPIWPPGLAQELGVGLKTIDRAVARLQRLELINRWPAKKGSWESRIEIRYPNRETGRKKDSAMPEKTRELETPLPEIEAKWDLLVQDTGRTLGDFGNLPLYRALCRIYSEPAIRQALSEVRQTPDARIKKSKTALFLYLLRKHANS